uniref:Putative secreted protein n=1 Tax=Ixodes ricinus TaxID=34613 RepID=A0A6B0UCC7_IXORI
MTRRYGLLPCVCGAFSSPFCHGTAVWACVTERCLDGRTYWCRKNRFLLHSSKYSFGTGLLPLAVLLRTSSDKMFPVFSTFEDGVYVKSIGTDV